MTIKTVKLLADLVEPTDTILDAQGEPGEVASIKRERKRLRLGLTIEFTDGRSIEVGASRYVDEVVAA